MPSLENLRKQAKQILRWHRERYYPVAAQIRALPRYRHLRDPEVFERSFKLSDAQELVARSSGFESWQALKAGVETMNRKEQCDAPRPAITAAEPQLFVTDIEASVKFFTQKLGFAVGFVYGKPPFYAQVIRDGARLNLRHVDKPLVDARVRERESLLSASMTVATASEIKQLFLEFQSASGVVFHQTLKKEPWGVRNFIVKDPDGNLLLFGGPVE
jgi:catechol 2,3-dioxygenase-like lactoylglutathione lyase family enzyme